MLKVNYGYFLQYDKQNSWDEECFFLSIYGHNMWLALNNIGV